MSLNKDRALLSQCKQVLRSELRSYDSLSRSARIRYEKQAALAVDEGLFASQTYTCAHSVSLIEPCTQCQRTDEDCIPYKVQLQSRLKTLLSILEGK